MTRADVAHEPFAEWSALAAVGALDGADRERFDAHLAEGCGTCEANLRELSSAAAALPWALPDVPLGPEVRERLMARVAASRAPRSTVAAPAPAVSTSARGRPVWRWAGGLVAAGLATALVWSLHDARESLELERSRVVRLEQELVEQRAIASLVARTDTHVAGLRGSGAAARADGWIVWSPSRREGFAVVHHLPSLPAGQHYRLWVVNDAVWLPAGQFEVDAIGHAALIVRAPREHPERFAVTVEPVASSAGPSRPPVMEGRVSS